MIGCFIRSLFFLSFIHWFKKCLIISLDWGANWQIYSSILFYHYMHGYSLIYTTLLFNNTSSPTSRSNLCYISAASSSVYRTVHMIWDEIWYYMLIGYELWKSEWLTISCYSFIMFWITVSGYCDDIEWVALYIILFLIYICLLIHYFIFHFL